MMCLWLAAPLTQLNNKQTPFMASNISISPPQKGCRLEISSSDLFPFSVVLRLIPSVSSHQLHGTASMSHFGRVQVWLVVFVIERFGAVN